MNNKNLLYKIGFNTAVQFSGKAISVALGFLTVAMLTRYLGTEGYGNFTLVFAYMSFFAVFADFGLQLAIVRELSQKTVEYINIYGTYFWIKTVLILISTILAVLALFFFPYSQFIKIGILIGALAVGVGGLSSFGSTIFQSNIRLDLVTLVDVVTKVVSVTFIALFVYLKFNFYFIVSTVLIGNIIGLFLTIVLLKNFIHFNFKFDKILAKKIIKWSIPIGLTSFFSLAYFRLDTIMLSVIKGSAEVGIYSLSYKILENILVLWGLYMASIYPLFSKYSEYNNRSKFNEILKSNFFIAILSSSLIVVLGFVLAPIIIGVFGGSNFNDSVLPFRILLFSVPLFFITNSFYNIFVSIKKVHFVVYLMFISLIINLILNTIFIPKFSYLGASITTVATEFMMLVGYLIVLKRIKL